MNDDMSTQFQSAGSITLELTDDPIPLEQTSKYDVFDLESAIHECWAVTDDLKNYFKDDEMATALSIVYQAKFDRLWEVFKSVQDVLKNR